MEIGDASPPPLYPAVFFNIVLSLDHPLSIEGRPAGKSDVTTVTNYHSRKATYMGIAAFLRLPPSSGERISRHSLTLTSRAVR
jgi:hypothetical protein